MISEPRIQDLKLEEKDSIDDYFECVNECSLDSQGVECVTQCIEVHLKDEME